MIAKLRLPDGEFDMGKQRINRCLLEIGSHFKINMLVPPAHMDLLLIESSIVMFIT